MKARVFLTFIFISVMFEFCAMSSKSGNHWNDYKKMHKKKYSPEDESGRRSIYKKVYKYIMNHNKDFDSGKKSYSLGPNEFSDMTDEEFLNLTRGLDQKIKCKKNSMIYSPPDKATIPDNLDWNEKGYVTPVQSQGSCGACWAFCGVATLEGQHKRVTGKLVKLSEQQLIDCSSHVGNNKCQGGQMCRAYESAITAGGINTESFYPYKNEAGKCKFSKHHIGSVLKGYLKIPYGDEIALLMAVALVGPIAAGVDGSQPHFRHYKSGIYDDSGCSNTTLNHAVTIIGYGTEKGKDYWLVKNSWGPHWGDNGFGKIIRNKNNRCGLASNALFPVLREKSDGTPLLKGPVAGKN